MNKDIDGVKIQNYFRYGYFLNLLKYIIPLFIVFIFSLFYLPDPYNFEVSIILFSIISILVPFYIFLPLFTGKEAFFLPTNCPYYTSYKTLITEKQLQNGCGYDYMIFLEAEVILTLEDKKYFFEKEKIEHIEIESESIVFKIFGNEKIELKGFQFNRKKADRFLKFVTSNSNIEAKNLV